VPVLFWLFPSRRAFESIFTVCPSLPDSLKFGQGLLNTVVL
jgi:hypothetical protein